jgi:ATP-binding cassette subfamily A (ABC1) protein 3
VNLKLEDDVKAESNRIKNANINQLISTEPLVVSDLVKEFKKGKKKFLAVNHLSFGISPNECFGFLGSNGAGKTTTFKILTGEIPATLGKAYINSFDISKQMLKARQSLAFCPQFDYLLEFLTVRDTLQFFSKIRGLKKETINDTVDSLIQVFKLNEFEKTLVQKLSGGNKRKLSSAISFIGRPKVVFMDEPTSGMDPAARRYLWTVIKKARDSGMTIVLTTHSMEECEALASKLGIIINGQFKCFGSVQHLKDKYGKGYSLIVKFQNACTDDDISRAEKFIQNEIKFSKQTG